MKKLFLLILGVTMLFGITKAQVSYGVKAGVNLANVSKVDTEMEEFKKNLTTFYVTGFVDLPLSSSMSIQPGLSLQGKGVKLEGESEGVKGKINTNLMSIELPVNFVYYVPAGSGKVFFGAGPYVGIHVSGKAKSEVEGGDSETTDLTFSGDDRDFNRFDAGLNFLTGYKFGNGLLLNAGYGLGLSNIAPDQDFKSSHRVLSFGVGYQF